MLIDRLLAHLPTRYAQQVDVLLMQLVQLLLVVDA